MSVIIFREPNFRCRVSRPGESKKFWRLCYAADQAKARELVEGKNLIVHQVEPYNFQEAWFRTADEATKQAAAAVQAGGKWKFLSLWGDLKDHLLDLFNGKCAYCEADFQHVAYGDVEHYRPKGEVSEDVDHPGYYWLAYDPHNYLPSCQLCNQYAKKNHFPIAETGRRAYKPDDSLEAEKPLLLNPTLDTCSEHLEYMPSNAGQNAGYAQGISEKGITTIEVMKLNRQDLVNRRLEQQGHVRLQIKQALVTEDRDTLTRVLREVASGQRQFFSAAICEINDFFGRLGLLYPFCD